MSLRCGGIFNNHIIANLLLSAISERLLKSLYFDAVMTKTWWPLVWPIRNYVTFSVLYHTVPMHVRGVYGTQQV